MVTVTPVGKTVFQIHTDGSSIVHRDGGWASIITYPDNREEVLTGGRRGACNMEMELTAVVESLKHIKETGPTVITDFLQGTSENIAFFIRRQSMKHRDRNPKSRKSVLWVELGKLLEEKKPVFKWVKGHSGNPGNTRADTLARQAAEQVAANHRLNKTA